MIFHIPELKLRNMEMKNQDILKIIIQMISIYRFLSQYLSELLLVYRCVFTLCFGTNTTLLCVASALGVPVTEGLLTVVRECWV